MRTQIKAGEYIDTLTREELHGELEAFGSEFVAGYLRPPEWREIPAGVDLDGSGNAAAFELYTVEVGYEFVLTRLEIFPDGYSQEAPFNPGTQGGLDIYRDGRWRDGVPFGGTTGFTLPIVYTQSVGRAIHAQGGQELTLKVTGGPASTGLNCLTCGFLKPLPPT